MIAIISSATENAVFVYTGPRGERVPPDVVRVLIDPSVTSIPAYAFNNHKKLAEVELSEGLVEIGKESFAYCSHSITRINIPTSLRRICDDAFRGALRCHIHLNDGIERIGNAHSLAASSPALESRPSSPPSPRAC
jgi:hypothetical protein